MPQRYAHHDTDCTGGCYSLIAQDEPVYFLDGEKYCLGCATTAGLVCPRCDSQKKPQFRLCYDCGAADRPAQPVGWGQAKGGVKSGTGGAKG